MDQTSGNGALGGGNNKIKDNSNPLNSASTKVI